jgi:hypothetical protein
VTEPPTSDHPIYFDQLAAAVEEIGRLQWTLGQVVTLADDARGLSTEQLRNRLPALAKLSLDRARPGSVRAALTER